MEAVVLSFLSMLRAGLRSRASMHIEVLTLEAISVLYFSINAHSEFTLFLASRVDPRVFGVRATLSHPDLMPGSLGFCFLTGGQFVSTCMSYAPATLPPRAAEHLRQCFPETQSTIASRRLGSICSSRCFKCS